MKFMKFLPALLGLALAIGLLLIVKQLISPDTLPDQEDFVRALELMALVTLFCAFLVGKGFTILQAIKHWNKGRRPKNIGPHFRDILLIFTTLAGSLLIWLGAEALRKFVEQLNLQ